MTSPRNLEADFGWALGTVMRAYLCSAGEAVAGLPGGPRGYQVLTSACREPRSQLAMAQHLGVDRTVMTYLLDDLEKAGLVERKPDPADRRARRVLLTEAGTARLCEVERTLRRVEDHLLDSLEPAERETLRSLLQRVAITIGEDRPDPCDMAEEMAREPAYTHKR